MSDLFLVAIAGAVTAVVVAAGIWLTIKFNENKKAKFEIASAHLDKFYMGAQKIIKDDTIPDEIVDFLGYLSQDVGTPKMAWRFTSMFCAAAAGSVARKPVSGSNAFGDAIESLTSEQKDLFFTTYMEGNFASVYSDTLFCWVHFDLWRQSIEDRKRVKNLEVAQPKTAKVVTKHVADPKTEAQAGKLYERFLRERNIIPQPAHC